MARALESAKVSESRQTAGGVLSLIIRGIQIQGLNREETGQTVQKAIVGSYRITLTRFSFCAFHCLGWVPILNPSQGWFPDLHLKVIARPIVRALTICIGIGFDLLARPLLMNGSQFDAQESNRVCMCMARCKRERCTRSFIPSRELR